MGPLHRSRGFTLIEIVVVMLIIAVLIAMAAALTRGVAAAQKRSLTATRMAGVDTAIILFVQQQRRLPCPADGTKASSANGAGLEEGGGGGACSNNQQHGVVPWRTLGITETESTDGWDRRITYRVVPALALTNAMDMSGCDPAATDTGGTVAACAAGCTSANLAACTHPKMFVRNRGLEVRDLAGAKLMDPGTDPYTGAAYVVISAGETGGGAYLPSGTLGASTSSDGTEELKNYASQPHTAGVTYYVDNSVVDAAGTGHFDDIVSRQTIVSVLNKAGLGPRSH
jgi:prepilin-type N-terminal cleavage/methylation domain-containing protein